MNRNENIYRKYELKKLDRRDLLHYTEFLLRLVKLTTSKAIQPVFRGDNLENLFYRLGFNHGYSDENLEEFLKRFYMIGQKSKHFFDIEVSVNQNKRNIGIDDVGDHVFEIIFDNIFSVLKSKNSSTKAFFDKNEEFYNFFKLKRGNKINFLKKISELKGDGKLYFKDYYLRLLHQLGSIKYKSHSHFVSTSPFYKIAQGFACNDASSQSVIIHTWSSINYRDRKYKNIELPKYKGEPYRSQRENSFFAGILPHFIIGLEIIEQKKFFINPNIFVNEITDDLFFNGLKIDQEEFDVILKKTRYSSSYKVLGSKFSERH
jgi:hypothetical protein